MQAYLIFLLTIVWWSTVSIAYGTGVPCDPSVNNTACSNNTLCQCATLVETGEAICTQAMLCGSTEACDSQGNCPKSGQHCVLDWRCNLEPLCFSEIIYSEDFCPITVPSTTTPGSGAD